MGTEFKVGDRVRAKKTDPGNILVEGRKTYSPANDISIHFGASYDMVAL